ncbi:GntR family transcriptional regulator [Leifsonia sp. NPDC014704]|uniref:GntR family transcriptional regulator n=1 Tax=unclassified Leifsonia TaxID=2663824 RepID=UPI0008929EFA|nr:GntR family transcriptional regulator [Leifsonia sp. 21MFCrub1.1]SEB08226.1 transcriptional regulator, GntR family [Leifsonia sp. 21MFCrub1.1]
MTDRSLHNQLLREVREAAAANAPLPGELELTARLGCTRQQLRNALAELERQGILRRRQGAPTTVDQVGLRMSVRLEDQFEHTVLLSRMGYEAEVEILRSEVEPLPPSIAALLDAEPGSPALRSVKRWRADGRPAMLASGYLLLPDGAPRELDDSVFTAVTQVWNESLVWEVATPGAAALDAGQAALLERPEGTPVMTFELIGVSVSGRRLFYAFEHHLPEVVRYSFARTVRPPWDGV